ncbi:MAG: magnesium and cobalt transport protein CorA [Nocardioidaceae bacterium]
MIVDSAVYRDGVRVPINCDSDDFERLRSIARRPGEFVWIGLFDPDTGEMDRVAAAFKLHPLAVEDSVHAHQRPKVERFGETMFVVLKTLWYVDAHDAVETGQIMLFAGPDFVISVRHGEGAELHHARIDLEHREGVLGHGPAAVVYAVLDRVVDEYEAVAAHVQNDVDEVEEAVFSPIPLRDSRRIYILKRELAEMHRAIAPLREYLRGFADGSIDLVPAEALPWFRDVYDHVLRVNEVVDSLDNVLGAAFQAFLARVSVQQNEDMRKISAWAAIAAVSTLVAGVYGMNFHNMPELHWHLGYYFSLALMAGLSFTLWRLFKRSGWL